MSATYRYINVLFNRFGFNLSRGPGFGMADVLRRTAMRFPDIQTVVDIGASDGKWSKDAMHYFKRAGFVGIDPLKEHEKELQSIRLKYPQFDYVIAAAGETDGGEVIMRVQSDDLDSGTVDGANPGVDRTVPLRSLDGIMDELKLGGPFFLKFDTHGYEIPILHGGGRVLEQTAAILMEVHNFHIAKDARRFPQMCQFLEDLGFLPLDVGGLLLREYDASFWQMDILFARKQYAAFEYNRFR